VIFSGRLSALLSVKTRSFSSSSIEPAHLRKLTLKLQNELGQGPSWAQGARQFDATIRLLLDEGIDALRPRDDLILASNLLAKSDVLDEETLEEHPTLIGAILIRWQELFERNQVSILWPILWKNAFASYFLIDDESLRKRFRAFLSATLPLLEVGSASPRWVPVVKRHGNVLGNAPAKQYAQEWLLGERRMLEELKSEGSISDGSWFWSDLVGEVITNQVNQGDGAFHSELDQSLGLIDDFPRHRDMIVAKLLNRYAKSNNPTSHDQLLQVVLGAWGSPQLDLSDRSHRWSQASKAARELVCQWIAESDLADFFELIKSSRSLSAMDQRRFEYWKRFTKRMQYTKLVLGLAFKATTNSDVGKFVNKRRERLGWLRGSLPDNIAILIKIDDWWFVEFGQTGNACYVYQDANRPFALDSRIQDLSSLKDKDRADRRLSHIADWESDFDRVLSSKGIWPNQIGAGASKRGVPEVASVRSILGEASRAELDRVLHRVVDSRGKGGSFWIETHGKAIGTRIQEGFTNEEPLPQIH
jgi:hypothetical protein